MNIVDYARKYIGVQETQGSNRGPQLSVWEHLVFGAGYQIKPISWCGVFVFAMLMEFNTWDRKTVTAKLGFPLFYPESSDSWLQTAIATKKVTSTVKTGDVFLWMRQTAPGVFSKTDAHHVGFVAEGFTPKDGATFKTLEGNTTPAGTGLASREGTGVFAKARTYHNNEFVFVSVADELVTKA